MSFTVFRKYETTSTNDFLTPRQRLFNELQIDDQQFLQGLAEPYLSVLARLETAIKGNASLARAIAWHAEQVLVDQVQTSFYSVKHNSDARVLPSASDEAIARATIRQFYRDWSTEGASERDPAHKLILKSLKAAFDTGHSTSSVRVLVPGAGLCRLPYNLACKGYSVEANEMSYHQLIASHFILNRPPDQAAFQLSP
jgi:carnosine N-methyltransferase